MNILRSSDFSQLMEEHLTSTLENELINDVDKLINQQIGNELDKYAKK